MEMLKYYLSAMALKVFSCSPSTKRLYRAIGNNLGGRQRAVGQMPSYYLTRIENMLRLARTYGVPKDGDRIIELGTGWLHWEAITTRLFFNVQGTLLDVWDNRHMGGLKNYLKQLDAKLDVLTTDEAQREAAQDLITRILEAKDFARLYELLGFEYVIDHDGALVDLEKQSYDLAVSGGVLEHVSAKAVPDFVKAIAALLKPGGYSVHSINIRDHLYQYDSAVSPKQYLRYSNRAWRLFFENDVQYINKIQRSEWLEFFSKAGFLLVEEESALEDLAGLKIAGDYNKYEETDLRCGNLRLVHRKVSH
jgi:SAM-dependent methyltransferase